MINIEYKAKVLSDGHLSCPVDIKKKLHLSNGSEVKVIIVEQEQIDYTIPKTEERTGLCGIWQDDRNAKEIIHDIYSNRRGFKEVVL
ncbi:MAG: hypothetical protein AB1414_17830 [bacterium]